METAYREERALDARWRIAARAGKWRGAGTRGRYDPGRLTIISHEYSGKGTEQKKKKKKTKKKKKAGEKKRGVSTRCADCTEEDGVVLAELVKAAVGYVLARPFVGFGTPVVVGEVEVKRAKSLCETAQDGNAGGYHLRADAVGAD